MRRFLVGVYLDATGHGPGTRVLEDAVLTLDAHAVNRGAVVPVHYRVARLADRIEIDLGDDTHDAIVITADGWRVLNDSPFPLVCFTHETLGNGEHQTKRFIDRIIERRRVWISNVHLPRVGWALRACVTSYRTNEGDVDVLMDELRTVLADV
jgi:hypothetical protein